MFIYLTNDENSVLETYGTDGALISIVDIEAPITRVWMESIQNNMTASSVSIFDIVGGYIMKISTSTILANDVALPVFEVPSDVLSEIQSLIP